MFYDLSFLGPWLALAAILGVAVGMNAEAPDWNASWRDSWFKKALIGLVIAVVIAWLHIFSGRFGFWWESAILFVAIYLLFGALGARFKRNRSAK
jgi:membrane protein YdbS with pleckstrin-like domain